MDIIIDFDNTMVDSNGAILELASRRDGIKYNKQDILDYSFGNVLKNWTEKEISDLFVSKEFYEVLKPFDNVITIIKKLKERGHTITVCTITRKEGILLKGEYIDRIFGGLIDEVIYIDNFKNNKIKMNKRHIICDLVIDDHIDNLKSVDSVYKICFGDYNYNKDYEGIKADNWINVGRLVKQMENELKEIYGEDCEGRV